MSSYADSRSKGKGKVRAKARSGSSRYPSAWSEWQWSSIHECYTRYRLTAPDQYEYDFDNKEIFTGEIPRTGARTVSGSVATNSSTSSYTTGQNYYYGSAEFGPSKEDTFTAPGNSYSQSSSKESGQTFGSVAAFTCGASTDSPDLANLTNQMGASSISGTHSSPSTHIKSREPYSSQEKLDSRYQVHSQWHFQVGTVFKILWSEPAGGRDGFDQTEVTDNESYTKFGEKIHSKIRRFVVVKPNAGHSLCVPVLTYQGQGVNKKGIHIEGHAALYSSNGKPSFAPGEVLHIKPISVQMSSPREKLDPMTRINFNKIYTVEHNVKILIIGKIHPDHERQFCDAWAESMGFIPSSSTTTPSAYGGPPSTTHQMSTAGYAPYTTPVAAYANSNSTGYGMSSTGYYNEPQSQPQTTYSSGNPSSYGPPNPSSNTLGPTYKSNDHMTQDSPQSSASSNNNYYHYNNPYGYQTS